MNIQIKPGVQILFIDDRFLSVCNVISEAFRLHGEVCVLTSAADGVHGENSFHKTGLGWDFRAYFKPVYGRIYITIRNTLKQLDSCYDTVFEKQKGNEHFHVEYDQRRADKLRLDKTGLEIYNPNNKEVYDMAKAANWTWLISLAATILGVILKNVTKKFRDEAEKWINDKYKEALETENPWDDMFFETLAKILSIELPD